MNRDRLIGIIAMIVTVIIWGVSFVNIRVAVMVLPAMTLGLIRFIIATAIMFVAVIVKKKSLKIHKEDFIYFLLAGGVGITAYFYFENNGIKYTSASIASLIIASIPVFAIITESIIYKKKITFKVMICLVLSILGVLMISGFDIEEIKASGYLTGYLMMFGAAITWIVYSVASKNIYDKYDQVTLVFYQFLIGMLCFVPFAVFEKTDWSLVTFDVMIHVIILGVFASAVGFFLYLIGLDKLGITESSLYINIIPLVTVITSIFYLGETITINHVIGGTMVMLSVYFINKESKVTLTEVKEY